MKYRKNIILYSAGLKFGAVSEQEKLSEEHIAITSKPM